MAASDYVPIFFKKPLALGGASTDEYTPLALPGNRSSSPRRARRVLRAYLRRGGLLRTNVVEQVHHFLRPPERFASCTRNWSRSTTIARSKRLVPTNERNQ